MNVFASLVDGFPICAARDVQHTVWRHWETEGISKLPACSILVACWLDDVVASCAQWQALAGDGTWDMSLGLLHEALIQLFRNQVELIPALLAPLVAGRDNDVPVGARIRKIEPNFTKLVSVQYLADFAVMMGEGATRLGIIPEVQLHIDQDKRRSWPWYAASLYLEHDCPVYVFVVTRDEVVAKWAEKAICYGGSTCQPVVLRPRDVPLVRDIEEARANPEFAVFSAAIHGNDDPKTAMDSALLAQKVLSDRTDDLSKVYTLTMVAALDAAVRKEFMKMADINKNQIDYIRGYIDIGKVEGKAEGKAESVLTVLGVQGLVVSPEQEERIRSCSDVTLLDLWLRKAIGATTVDCLFSMSTSST